MRQDKIDHIKFVMGVVRKDDPLWADSQFKSLPDYNEELWGYKIWRVVHDPNFPAHPYLAAHIPLPEHDLRHPLNEVYEKAGRYYVNVKTKHEGKALMIGKQLIKWELEKCENK